MEDEDHPLLNYQNVSCPPSTAKLLETHQQELTAIYEGQWDKPELQGVPVLEWIKSTPSYLPGTGGGMVPYTGNLSTLEQAEVANWIDQNIPGAKGMSQKWMSKPTMAHALNIVLAAQNEEYLIKVHHQQQTPREPDFIQLAWDHLQSHMTWKPKQDVDQMCIRLLEREMFTTGTDGDYQWGLDVGDHQGRWNPYEGIPYDWRTEEAEITEEEPVRHYFLTILYPCRQCI